jgi:tetratricopeptide (TPR) repeat protein
VSEPKRFSWRHWWNAGLLAVLLGGLGLWWFFDLDGRWVLLAVVLYFGLGWFVSRSILYEHLGFLDRFVFHDYEKAASRYRKAIQSGGATPQAKAALGSLCFAQGDLNEAANLLEEALKDLPEDADLKALLTKVLIRQGRIDEGEQIALSDDSELLRNLALGRTMQAKKEHEAAGASYQELLKKSPHLPEGLLGLAQVCYALGDPKASNEGVSAALRQNPTNPDALFWKGRVEEALGKPENALEFYEEALLNRPINDHSYDVSYKDIVESVSRLSGYRSVDKQNTVNE